MKKRILALLLSSTLLFGGLAENITAKEMSTESDIVTEALEETEETDLSGTMAEETEQADFLEWEEMESRGADESEEPDIGEYRANHMPTGYRKPVLLDLNPAEITDEDIYDESETQSLTKSSARYRSVWDSYSTNYYYNSLSTEERSLWDKLDDMCYGYLVGTESLTRRESTFVSERTVYYYPTKSVLYDSGKLSAAQANNVICLFYFSNPQYYFLEAYMGAAYGFAQMSVNASFANGASRQMATRNIESEIQSWLAEINLEETDWAKEKKIHDMICEKVIYDPYYNMISANPYNQTIYSVFCTNSTVCAGYSQTMQLLCNAVGIDCGVVTSEEHEWNIVRLNDTWYYVDCTWNDEDNGYGYEYFNRSEQYFMADNPAYVPHHTPEEIWNGRLPALTYDSGATYDDPGSIYDPEEKRAGTPVISCPGSVVTITAPAGGTVYYTTNGGEPSSAFSKAIRYTGPFPLYGNTTVKAMVVSNGYWDSEVSSSTITPLYRITFLANGGYIGSSNVSSLSKSGLLYYTNVGQLPVAKRSGYAFEGWYTSPSGGSQISAATKITADSNYYARWTKIKTQKAVLSTVKNKSKRSIKIQIKKISNAKGYQIRYSLKKSMKSSKKKDASGNTYTISKLKKGKTYYVQARMYQIDSVSGKRKYGAWSKAKSVTIKK